MKEERLSWAHPHRLITRTHLNVAGQAAEVELIWPVVMNLLEL